MDGPVLTEPIKTWLTNAWRKGLSSFGRRFGQNNILAKMQPLADDAWSACPLSFAAGAGQVMVEVAQQAMGQAAGASHGASH
jgi:hypothetical protein